MRKHDFSGRIFGGLASARGASAFLALLFLGSVAYFWHGFGPGDEAHYVRAAFHWLEDGPYLGDTHWSLRHLLVLPIAASFSILGPGVFAATLPNILYAGGLLAITWFFGRRYLGHYEALMAAALMALSPFVVARPMELVAYGPELFFTATAAWLFVAAQFEPQKIRYLFLSGVVAGFAWMMREVSVASILGFGVLLLLFHRQRFFTAAFALAIGFGAVLLFELALYGLAADDPFYRYKVDLGHAGRPAMVSELEAQAAAPQPSLFDWIILPYKDIATYPMTAPFVFFALIATGLLWREIAATPGKRRRALTNFVMLSVIAPPVAGAFLHLAMPHYYPILTYTAYMIIGVACVEVFRKFNALAAALCLGLVVLLNFVTEDFRNYDDYAEPEYLASHAAVYNEAVYTDYVTASRTRMLMRLAGVPAAEAESKIKGVRRPADGALYFKAYPTTLPPADPSWCLIEATEVRTQAWTHALLRSLGAERIKAARVRAVVTPTPPAKFYRVTPSVVHADPVTGIACAPVK